jgi:hypothetical protein
MRVIWSVKNTYIIYNQDQEIGWIRFIKWPGRPGWFIDEVSDRLPVTKADFDAEGAKAKLISTGLSWKAGINKPTYIYR